MPGTYTERYRDMTPQSERRSSYRLPLEPGQAVVRFFEGPPVELRDLSASGASLVVRGPGTQKASLPPVEIDLGDGETIVTQPEVVTIRAFEPGVLHLGARWGALAPDQLRKLSRFITREFQRRNSDPARLLDSSRALTVTNPLFIRNLLGQRGPSASVISVIDRNLRLGAQLRVEDVTFQEGRRVIRARFVGDDAPALSGDQPYEFVLQSAGAVTVFESRCLDQIGADVTLALPEEVRQASSRDSRRIDVSDPATPLHVSFAHPRLAGERIAGEVFNVAAGGLSFRVPRDKHGLFPGDRLADFRIQLPSDACLVAQAGVRSIADRDRPDFFSCGVQLTFTSQPDRECWRRFVFDRMHPNLVDGNGLADSAWDLLEASKYVELWTAPQAREHVRGAYLASWQASPSEIGHSLVLRRQERSVGLSAGSVIYPRGWLLHHLARDGRGDAQNQAPLRDASELISGILHRLKTETDFQFFLIYLERGKRFNERLYIDFADRYFDKSKLLIKSMEVFRRSVDVASPATADAAASAVDIVNATPQLLAILAHQLAATCSPIEIDALALDRERLDLAGFTQFCAQRGYERRRDLFFAVNDGQLEAALIAESGGEGVNLFGLLNSCRIVPLGPDRPSQACREALLRRAIAHYRDAGKKTFLLFEDPGAGDEAPARLGFELISGGLQWIAHRDVLPAWAAYLDGLLASTPAPSQA